KPGLTIEVDGEVYQIMRVEHIKPGRGAAVVKTKLRNVRTGAIVERTFRSGERVERAIVERREAIYLYNDGTNYYFQDMDTFDEIVLTPDQVEDMAGWLKEGESITIVRFEGTVIGIEVPPTVERQVIQTEPGIRGDTASGGSKPAVIEGGITVQVPLFVNEGDIIKVDTRSGEYVERVK
ncbi:MAG: elongation factor P, partial [Armatimonadetes bacterium]|nr:elongation factor P [Armatimonadota bacterium]